MQIIKGVGVFRLLLLVSLLGNIVPSSAWAQGAAANSGSSSHPNVSQGVPYDYQIGAGDLLHIEVWKEPEASSSVVVRPDGKISMPLLKEVQVLGLTPTQAEKVITEGLSKTITDPDVTVVVTGINSKKIYAIGE